MRSHYAFWLLIELAIVACRLPAAPDNPTPQEIIESQAGLDPKSIQRLLAGLIVSKVLQSRAHSEVAVLGATMISVPAEYFLDQFRDIRTFKHGSEVLQTGTFGKSLRFRCEGAETECFRYRVAQNLSAW